MPVQHNTPTISQNCPHCVSLVTKPWEKSWQMTPHDPNPFSHFKSEFGRSAENISLRSNLIKSNFKMLLSKEVDMPSCWDSKANVPPRPCPSAYIQPWQFQPWPFAACPTMLSLSQQRPATFKILSNEKFEKISGGSGTRRHCDGNKRALVFAKSSHYICLVKVSHFYNGRDSIKSLVLDNVTKTWKIMSSPAHESMEQGDEGDIVVAAEDEHGGCCSGIDPNKALERITDK